MSQKQQARDLTGFLPHSRKRKAVNSKAKTNSKRKAPKLENESIKANLPLATFNTVMYEPIGLDRKHEFYGPNARKSFMKQPNKVAVYDFVVENFQIPERFDESASSLKFGARSGMCYEERIVRAYTQKKFELKPNSKLKMDGDKWKMCSDCGKLGHFPIRCPSAFA
mmetsp:Transcript_738/g.908  ORF Transcript_738/g.908 Transcript_738/m.908 type:complete len:167 (-) Transcript_738:307-807(-)